ncbi:MAG: ABC transporter substrate-binding protein [Acidimicrobiia bacterium]
MLLVAACAGAGETTTTTAGGAVTTSEATGTTSPETTEATGTTVTESTTTTVIGEVPFPAEFVEAAEAAALEAAGGEQIGGVVEIQGHNGGFEQDLVVSSLGPFTTGTGIEVQYTGGQDLGTRVETRVRAGDPPDVVQDSAAGNLVRYANEGALVPLDSFMDAEELRANFSPGVLASVTVDGQIYSPPSTIHPQMVWYNPHVYGGALPPGDWDELIAYSQELADAGQKPWCMALSAGPNTGFPNAYLIETIFIKTYGAELATQWAQGELPWTSPEVKDAFENFGIIGTEDAMVYPGVAGALAAPITDGPVGLFSDPPGCEMFHFGIYTGGIILSQFPDLDPAEDMDFYALPAINPDYAKHEQASGWGVFAFNDTPQVQALMKYWASEEFQSLLASGGSWVMANNKVSPDAYPTDLLRKGAQQFVDADDIAFGPWYAGSNAVREAFGAAIVQYMQDPGSLDGALARVQDVVDGES